MLFNHEWVEFVKGLSAQPHSYSMIQERKFFQSVHWEVPLDPRESPFEITPEQMGYQPRSTKITQLKRTYFNEESLASANLKMRQRIQDGKSQTSVAASMVAGKKRGESQGHCMQSVVATHTRLRREEEVRVHFFYRSTEVIQKFAADLDFLSRVVLPTLLEGVEAPIVSVAFYFSGLYLSPLFLPVLYNFVDPIEYLEQVRGGDPPFFKSVLFRTKAPLRAQRDYYNFRTRRNMHHLLLRLIDEGKIDREALEEYIDEWEGS